jgi:hypothetical protein
MTPTPQTRRTVLKALGAGAVGVLAAGQASAATALEAELATVREATAKYRDVGAALEDGFQPGGPYVPGMGWHWVNPERVQAVAENGPELEEPQMLVYADTEPESSDGRLVLVAVEWGIPLGTQGYTEDSAPDLFSDENAESEAEEHWHVHHGARHVVATGDGQQTDPEELSVADMLQRGQWAELPPDAAVQPGDEVTADWGLTGSEETRTLDVVPEPHPDLLTLHAWVHLRNREHMLAPMNDYLKFVEMLPNDILADHTAKPG